MNLKKLEMFMVVVDKGSFSEAAAYFSVSQPAISQQIRSLAHDLQVTLLEKDIAKVQPTPAGYYVYEKGQQLLAEWEAMTEGVQAYRDVLTGSLQIGASTIPDAYLLPYYLGVFHQQFPQVQLQVVSGDSREMFAALADRQIHVAVTAAKPDDERIVSHPMAKDSVVLVAPPTHPLTEMRGTAPKDWLAYDFVIREQGAGTRDSLNRMLSAHGLHEKDLRVGIQVGSTEALIAAVAQGIGVSVVSELAVTRALHDGRIVKIATIEPLYQAYYLCYLERLQHHAIVQAFSNVILSSSHDEGNHISNKART